MISFNENFKGESLHFYFLFNFIVLNTVVYFSLQYTLVGRPTYIYNIQSSKELKPHK